MDRDDVDERSGCTERDAVGGCSGETTCEGLGGTPALSTAGQKTGGHGALVKRLSRYGMHILPNAFARRSRLQRQHGVTDSATGAPRRFSADAPERGSLTPAMRKKYLKEFLLTTANGGFGGVLSTDTSRTSSSSREEEQDPQHTDLVLYPMEHAWMLSAVDGNYEALLYFIADDPNLLTRKDFICGFSVLHWLAKRGESETLDKLLRYAETASAPANVDLKGSGGLTPLHVASMHGQYTVIKLLVGAYGASVDVMDYSGKRAWQYLKGNAPLEMRELLGTWDDAHNTTGAQNANNSAAPTTQRTRVDEGHDDVDSLDRKAGTGSWSFKAFRDLFNSFFGDKR
ncbi:hypothetical protein CRUP_012834 [Coryphaenoides rupestris]|nr:hypothetical protein CRUP_012834 [Coryphaenoides rupestris]